MRHQAKLNATKCQHKLNQLWTNTTGSIKSDNRTMMMTNTPPEHFQDKFKQTKRANFENEEVKTYNLQTVENKNTENNNELDESNCNPKITNKTDEINKSQVSEQLTVRNEIAENNYNQTNSINSSEHESEEEHSNETQNSKRDCNKTIQKTK